MIKGKLIAIVVICILSYIIGFYSGLCNVNTTESKEQIDTTESTKSTETKESEKPIIQKITSDKLAKDYSNNEVKGDKQYKGQTYKITGEISNISTVLNETYVVLKGFEFVNVQCFIEDTESLEQLNTGDVISVLGTITGQRINVIMKSCVIVQ